MEMKEFYCLVRNDLGICHTPPPLPMREPLLGISWVLEEIRFDLGTATFPLVHLPSTAPHTLVYRLQMFC